MSFSDDQSSPAAPFSGDSTGRIFDLPEAAQGAPAGDRLVDTQSGFLVVVKRLNNRLALSIKRQLGTPPSSLVYLTPDESLKLSKILATSLTDDEQLEAHEIQAAIRGRRRSFQQTGSTDELLIPEVVPANPDLLIKMRKGNTQVPRLYGVSFAVTLLLLCGLFAMFTSQGTFHQLTLKSVDANDVLSPTKVEQFVTGFVKDMLDFAPETYRSSQIKAMSFMTPSLMNRYWQETGFPLAPEDMRNLPQKNSVTLLEIKQQKLSGSTVVVNVKALIKEAGSSTPLNMFFKLELDRSGRILVVEQKRI